ncbi:MAG: hypothetical protein NC826_01510 [Candidatus Omnitrophica bacterium]|nr:hypothetical protein [Candidatus Omnitrophota bacterium]
MSKIAMIGDSDTLLLFKTFGFEVYLLTEKEDLKEKIDLAIRENNSVIFIQENLLKNKEYLLQSYKDTVYPILMPFPFYKKDLGLINKIVAMASLKTIGKYLD